MHSASAEQEDAACALVDALSLEDAAFELDDASNPHLQRHWRVIEALALGEEPPLGDCEQGDESLPQVSVAMLVCVVRRLVG